MIAVNDRVRKRVGKNVNVWISASLHDAIKKAIQDSRRSLTAEVEIALEEYCKKLGLWPATDEAE